ncbi:methylenetetrahydrofolate--tRNA-(uracil(54)-C(5))-methyltransferase (FADH(2)-oxidizing) TrmFO [Candidatus Riflebacteria bacterium]
MRMQRIIVAGAGLAGCEAAWQLAIRGIGVDLWEMRPQVKSPAHKTDGFAELVCSNSLGTIKPERAPGILKQEMSQLGSLILDAAHSTKVKAGDALAVDRHNFSNFINKKLEENPNINIIRRELTSLPVEPTIIATGPLTSATLFNAIQDKIEIPYLYFHDAIAPIVEKNSIDYSKTFFQNRRDPGSAGDYLNCPMNRDEYINFVEILQNAETIELKDFEKAKYFSGCMPVEALAKKGLNTLRFGPLKPVGLEPPPPLNPSPYAVVQLRQEKVVNDAFNMVGFQTNLKYKAQKDVFRLIPGLNNAEFIRYGQMHRNSYINSPQLLNNELALKNAPHIYFAGQILGVEGYMESAAMGLLVGINLALKVLQRKIIHFPKETALGALYYYLLNEDIKNFQPMNINFSLFDSDFKGKKKEEKRKYISDRSVQLIKQIREQYL